MCKNVAALRLVKIIDAPLEIRSGLFFLFSLLVIFLAWQQPFTYTVNIGQGFNDSWEITRGWGDQEQNDHFSFRWTIDSPAEVRLPDLGWPSQVRVVGLAPRPDNRPPNLTLNAGSKSKTFPADAANSVTPPDEFGRLTFELEGPGPQFDLSPNHLTINSDLYQPQGDPRELGLAVSQVLVKPRANRFGFIIPPLAPWLGSSLVVALVFGGIRQGWPFAAGSAGAGVRVSVGRGKGSKYAVPGGIGTLLLFVIVRTVFPQWLAVNAAGIAWGIALPLLAWVILTRHPKALDWALWILLGGGLLAVFYGLTPAAFAAAIFVITAGLLLGLALKAWFCPPP